MRNLNTEGKPDAEGVPDAGPYLNRDGDPNLNLNTHLDPS